MADKGAILAELSALSGKISGLNSTKRKLMKKIKRLEDAQRKLQSKLEAMGEFQSQVSKLTSSLDQGTFRGNRRDKFNEKVDKIASGLNNEIQKHHSNSSRITAKIAELEMELAATNTAIGAAEAAADVLRGLL